MIAYIDRLDCGILSVFILLAFALIRDEIEQRIAKRKDRAQ